MLTDIAAWLRNVMCLEVTYSDEFQDTFYVTDVHGERFSVTVRHIGIGEDEEEA